MLSQRLGLVARRGTRSITFWVESASMLEPAVALAHAITRFYPRIDVVFVQPSTLDRGHGFPAYPVPLRVGVALLFKQLRTHTLILCGKDEARLEEIGRVAARRGSYRVLLRARGIQAASRDMDAILDVDQTHAEEGAEQLARCIESSRRRRMEQLGRQPLSVRILRAGREGPMRSLLALKFPEYTRIEDLRATLGSPGTILCLGNGPSSRHPGVEALTCDRLFRVNHSWKSRGGPFLAPDLVFTGQRDTVDVLRPTFGFVFGKILSEEKVLSRLLTSWRRVSYGTVERLGLHAWTSDGNAAPTNGALMVAVACALRPHRLVIAGIDLFSDPAGAYPGDATTENKYAVGHEASFELDFMVAALRGHAGELVVFGRALRAALRARGFVFEGED